MSSVGLEILLSIATALTAGFVVGAEREQGRDATFGGARTFPLYALAGAVGMLLGTWVTVALGIAVGSLLAIAYYQDAKSPEKLGMSTEVAAIVTFGLGALCTARDLGLPLTDRLLLVAAGATATLGLLSFKQPLHRLIERVSKEDVYATTKLLLLSVIVLPLLPNEEMGPWQSLNPMSIGLLVVLISGIGFAGYVAIRVFGARKGLGLTGLLGGLASSTAVTLTFAGRARQTPALVNGCAVAIVLASATMFPRVLLEVSAVSSALVGRALWPFLVTSGVALAAATLLYVRLPKEARSKKEDTPDLKIVNPFSLSSAFKFGLLFTVVLVASRAATFYFDDVGVYLSAVVAGVADADAIALSVARLHARGELDANVAVTAIGLSSAVNTVSKAIIATVLGGRRLGLLVGGSLGLALAAGAVVIAHGGS